MVGITLPRRCSLPVPWHPPSSFSLPHLLAEQHPHGSTCKQVQHKVPPTGSPCDACPEESSMSQLGSGFCQSIHTARRLSGPLTPLFPSHPVGECSHLYAHSYLECPLHSSITSTLPYHHCGGPQMYSPQFTWPDTEDRVLITDLQMSWSGVITRNCKHRRVETGQSHSDLKGEGSYQSPGRQSQGLQRAPAGLLAPRS